MSRHGDRDSLSIVAGELLHFSRDWEVMASATNSTKPRSRDAKGFASDHYRRQRIEREMSRCYGRIQSVLYYNQKVMTEISDLDSLVEFLFLYPDSVFSKKVAPKPDERKFYISLVVTSLKGQSIIREGMAGGYYIRSTALEYVSRSLEREKAIEAAKRLANAEIEAAKLSAVTSKDGKKNYVDWGVVDAKLAAAAEARKAMHNNVTT